MAPDRRFTCETCGIEALGGQRGVLPKQCPPCTQDRKRQIVKDWRAANPDRWQEQRKRAYYKNPEAASERHKRWYAANKETVAEYRRRLYEERQRETSAETVADYRRRNPGKHAEIENRRRARKLAAFVEPVDTDVVYARTNGACGICGELVDRAKASLDHIIPLSRGGEHSMTNVQIAHRSCNSRKGNRIPA